MKKKRWQAGILLGWLLFSSAALASPGERHRHLVHQVLTKHHWQLVLSTQQLAMYAYYLPSQKAMLLGCYFDLHGLYRCSVVTPLQSVWSPDYAGALAVGYILLQMRLSARLGQPLIEEEFARQHVPRKAVTVVRTVLDTLKHSSHTRFPFDNLQVQGEKYTEKGEAWLLITLTLY